MTPTSLLQPSKILSSCVQTSGGHGPAASRDAPLDPKRRGEAYTKFRPPSTHPNPSDTVLCRQVHYAPACMKHCKGGVRRDQGGATSRAHHTSRQPHGVQHPSMDGALSRKAHVGPPPPQALNKWHNTLSNPDSSTTRNNYSVTCSWPTSRQWSPSRAAHLGHSGEVGHQLVPNTDSGTPVPLMFRRTGFCHVSPPPHPSLQLYRPPKQLPVRQLNECSGRSFAPGYVG